jgi:hypothetical protein
MFCKGSNNRFDVLGILRIIFIFVNDNPRVFIKFSYTAS